MAYKDPDKRREYDREYQRTWRQRFPEKARARAKARYERTKNRVRILVKKRHNKNPNQRKGWTLKSLYGFSVERYNQLLLAQKGGCAICGCPPKSALAIDHDHMTGNVRGLLCSNCNLGLGQFNDSPELLIAAASYLGVRKINQAA